MDRTPCTEPQCLYKDALYFFYFNLEIRFVDIRTEFFILFKIDEKYKKKKFGRNFYSLSK